MKKILLLGFVLLGFTVKSQTYYYYSETTYTYGPYYFDQSMGLVRDILQDRKNEKLRQEYIAEMKTRTNTMRDYYSSLKDYPSIIPDGWHDVSIIVGETFIDSRKVLVENNKIKEVVWDNWMPEAITFSGPIINAKSAVQFEKPTKNTQGLVEVYFMNSIADSSSTTLAPLKPALLTFWTNSKYYNTMNVVVEGVKYGGFNMLNESAVECGDINAFNVYLKPGVYSYQAYASGSVPLISTRVELKSSECKVVEVVKPLNNWEKKQIEKARKKQEKADRKAGL